MDYIELIFKEYDLSFIYGIKIALLIAIPCLTFIIGYSISRNQDEDDAEKTTVTCLAITAVGIIFTMVAINVSALQVSKHYVQEAQEYISETLKESYDVTIADNDAEKLAQAMYGAIESNNDIIKSGRTAHDPIQVTTDEGTLITIVPIQDGDKLSIYKNINDDMVLMEKKDK